KAEYPLPMYVNAALRGPFNPGQPGQYASGGPTDNMLDVYKAAAPDIDLLAPDLYMPADLHHSTVLERHARPDNAQLVAGTRDAPPAARASRASTPAAVRPTTCSTCTRPRPRTSTCWRPTSTCPSTCTTPRCSNATRARTTRCSWPRPATRPSTRATCSPRSTTTASAGCRSAWTTRPTATGRWA